MQEKDNKSENLNTDADEKDIFERKSHYDPLKKIDTDREQKEAASASEPSIKSPLLTRVENFLYHYKWHTVIALFLVFVIVLCSVQTCTRTSFDSYILYAGGKSLRSTEDGESKTTYELIASAMSRFTEDCDKDGNRNTSFIDIYLPSDAEIKELEASERGVNHSLLKENDELFRTYMLSGEYYVCLISESLFKEWTKDEENNPFAPIKAYLPTNAEIAEEKDDNGYLLASEYGVYLKSTPAGDNPGFKHLPDDTVVCMRKYSKFSGSGKRGQENYNNAVKLICRILTDKDYTEQ